MNRFLIKWAGYPLSDKTDEPAQNIAEGVPEEVALSWERPNPKPHASLPLPDDRLQPSLRFQFHLYPQFKHLKLQFSFKLALPTNPVTLSSPSPVSEKTLDRLRSLGC